MYKINRFIVIISQLILLIDNTKQSKFKLGLAAFKAVGKTLKNPMVKKVGDTIKKSMSMLQKNKNTLKNFACNLEKKVLTATHKFGSRPVKYLGEAGVKHTVPQISRQGKKSIQMRSAGQISGKAKGFMPMAKGHLKGNELMSFVSAITKSKPFAPFLLAAGGLGTLQMNLVAGSDGTANMGIKKKEPLNDKQPNFGKNVEQPKKKSLEMYGTANMGTRHKEPHSDKQPNFGNDVDMSKIKPGQTDGTANMGTRHKEPLDDKQPNFGKKSGQTLENEAATNESKVEPKIVKPTFSETGWQTKKFDPRNPEDIKKINDDFYAEKKERFDEHTLKTKKLTKEFENKNQVFSKEFEQGNKKQTQKFKKNKGELAKVLSARRAEFQLKLKARTSEYKNQKNEMTKRYHEVNAVHLDKLTESNQEFLNQLADYNKEFRKKNSEHLKTLINKTKVLQAEVEEKETVRTSRFIGKFKYHAEELKNKEAAEKKELEELHKQKSTAANQIKIEEDALTNKYKELNQKVIKEFIETNKTSNEIFMKDNKVILDEIKQIADEIKMISLGPFKEFIEMNKDRVLDITKKTIDPITGKKQDVVLPDDELKLKEEYDLYQYLFPVEKKMPDFSKPNKHFKDNTNTQAAPKANQKPAKQKKPFKMPKQ